MPSNWRTDDRLRARTEMITIKLSNVNNHITSWSMNTWSFQCIVSLHFYGYQCWFIFVSKSTFLLLCNYSGKNISLVFSRICQNIQGNSLASVSRCVREWRHQRVYTFLYICKYSCFIFSVNLLSLLIPERSYRWCQSSTFRWIILAHTTEC